MLTAKMKDLKMEEQAIDKIDQVTLQFLEYNNTIFLIGFIALVITVIFSFKKGGIQEVIENLVLWFLFFMGFVYISTHPVTEYDEITGGIFFVSFGLCRIAKNIARQKAEKAN